MKGNTNNTTRQNRSMPNSPISRPQNKDDIDSRSNEEQNTKGDDVTHNKKEVQNERKKKENRS